MESANPTTAPTQMPPERRPDAPPVPAPSMAQRPGQALDSQVLLQGQGSVAIQHNGVVYRLQATRLGKLILTK